MKSFSNFFESFSKLDISYIFSLLINCFSLTLFNCTALLNFYRGIPTELLRKYPGDRLALDMEDHRDTEYKPPKKPFQGEGQRLGGYVIFSNID